jgi:hypothetical protein
MNTGMNIYWLGFRGCLYCGSLFPKEDGLCPCCSAELWRWSEVDKVTCLNRHAFSVYSLFNWYPNKQEVLSRVLIALKGERRVVDGVVYLVDRARGAQPLGLAAACGDADGVQRAGVPLAPDAASKKKEPIAIATKGEPFMTNVSLFGKTISLRHLSADLFAHLVNTEDTLGSADVASMHKIGYQGGYSRISNLRADLDAFQKGLSSCLTCVQSGNSQRYRFDIDAFRKAFKMK